ncbi:CoA synthetase, partial [bacterium]|nr:CoA synthetase [bacterium]
FTDWRRSRWAESYRLGHEVFADVKRFADFFFLGAIQIDQFGNCNLIGIGHNYHKLAFRGPGSGAAAVASTYCKRLYLISASHNRRIFVKKCDFISAFGWGEGGADARSKIGLPGGGPRYVVTPLCVMEFGDETRKMRLKSIHPGVDIDNVIENTGFELELPVEIPVTEPPTTMEIDIIRNRIDLEGQLRE